MGCCERLLKIVGKHVRGCFKLELFAHTCGRGIRDILASGFTISNIKCGKNVFL
jgi:hypothetical protein